MRKLKSLILLSFYFANCLAVPAEKERVEDDPELTAGFFEGDIELDFKRNGLKDTTQRWPNGVVLFRIDPVFDTKHSLYILQGMKTIESLSCIRFRHASDTTKGYVKINGESTGCSARVGYSGIKQNLNLRVDALDQGCFRIGSIMHELLHALGFYHQHSASNRDKYIRIDWDNITKDKEKNFKKFDSIVSTNFGVEYDYGSVLHYSSKAFSKNGEATIVPLKENNAVMGQRLTLSEGDILKFNKMYNC
ncbi:seminal metalloprotease 1-like [Calliphora vicina]|uniref:seminal metalloprotease 1-like n=1 Tax=Calliphora vicina TaxID=7373 RepID=UPI00325BB2FF